jgi:hypothetical protein
MQAYKYLSHGAIGPFSGFPWPAPGGFGPGEWVRVEGGLEPCGNGIHACRMRDLPYWINDELWEIELDGAIVAERRGLVAEQGRLVRPVDGWDVAVPELAQSCCLRARDTAVHVLEARRPSTAVTGLAAEERPQELAAGFAALSHRGLDDFGVHVAAYAADIAGYAASAVRGDATWASCTAYVTAVLEGFVASGDASSARRAPEYAAERERQAGWLARRLQLTAETA